MVVRAHLYDLHWELDQHILASAVQYLQQQRLSQGSDSYVQECITTQVTSYTRVFHAQFSAQLTERS